MKVAPKTYCGKNFFQYVCPRKGCSKSYKQRSGRAYHVKNCTAGPLESPRKKAKSQGEKYKCRYCSKVFSHRPSLSRHQSKDCSAALLMSGKLPNIKTPAPRIQIDCTHCDATFNHVSKYNRHLKKHQRSEYGCSMCLKSVKRL